MVRHVTCVPAGRCVGQRILSESSVHAGVGSNVTLKTPIQDLQSSALFWHFSDGKEIITVASVSSSTLRLNTSYEGRAWINAANGHLTLGALTPQDSGEYIITIVYKHGQSDAAKTRLTVSGESLLDPKSFLFKPNFMHQPENVMQSSSQLCFFMLFI